MLKALDRADVDVEERIHSEPLRDGACEVGRLAVRLRLPLERIAHVVDALLVRGAVTWKGDADSRAVAQPPAPTHFASTPSAATGRIEVLTERQKPELSAELVALRTSLLGVAEESSPGDAVSGRGPASWALRPAGPDHAARIQRGARHEVLHFDAPPYWSVDNTVQLGHLSDGVPYRTVYGRHAIEYPGAMVRINQCLEAGEQARVTSRLPMKMMIVDREHAIICAFGEGGREREGDPGDLVIVDPSPLLDGLIELFERVWADSVPFDRDGTAADAARDELGTEDKRLLTLLLSGLTDDAIARHLGVGRRTVLRRARSLMDRAGVATRMQLGWYAARQGWVEASRRAVAPGPVQG
ncbi:helix-turn-helix transcriptional regulator [Streptomyces sp. NBC_00846]|uniref:helix-turn-helix transcriptional regulator n=1 Tax=Streptomyces sp. NBC_00846 TaxID=2975849 RepID=UPI0038638AAE|nr:helix-turn-helix transcriptional regulator [Streptomyces sp. NBC_00846]